MPREFTFEGIIKEFNIWDIEDNTPDYVLYLYKSKDDTIEKSGDDFMELIDKDDYKGKITITLHDIDNYKEIREFIKDHKFYWNRANEDAIDSEPLIQLLTQINKPELIIGIKLIERIKINAEYNASTSKNVILLRKLPKEWIE